MSRYCVSCRNSRDGRFCYKCGEKTISSMLKCPECKKEVSMMDKFCEECGKPIHEAIKAHIEKERKEVVEK